MTPIAAQGADEKNRTPRRNDLNLLVRCFLGSCVFSRRLIRGTIDEDTYLASSLLISCAMVCGVEILINAGNEMGRPDIRWKYKGSNKLPYPHAGSQTPYHKDCQLVVEYSCVKARKRLHGLNEDPRSRDRLPKQALKIFMLFR